MPGAGDAPGRLGNCLTMVFLADWADTAGDFGQHADGDADASVADTAY